MKSLSATDREFICDIQAPCFQSLSVKEMEMIQESKTQVLFRRGENLTKQGAFASYVLFIINGIVKQYVEEGLQHRFNMNILQTGDFVGLSAVINRNTFNYSVVALKDTQVYLIEQSAILKVISGNGEFAFNIIKRYCEQNNLLYDIIRNMMYKQMHGRLADTLLYLGSERFAHEDLFNFLNRKDIAEFAGISVESTVKLLKVFEKDGLIRLEDKNIILTNREALLEISKRG
jgi:CRP/FNR family transcriptional regulator